jgi:phosphoglycerate dehydrogenase-like enzyme
LFQRPGVRLTNSQRVFGPAIAEHVMAFVLAYARGLPGYLQAQRDGQWAGGNPGVPGPERAILLSGKTMLVVGLGGIGTEVARRAHAFGMTVLAIRNSRAEPPPFVSRLGVPSDLAAWIKEADVVVDTLPLTADTKGMFDAKVFGAMKRTAFFVNVGRGGTVVTDDLVQALRQGTIAGAGLDVVDPEPLPQGHPLWTAPNLMLTPHTSGDADDERRIVWTIARENLRRYVAGGRLLSVVDVKRGY